MGYGGPTVAEGGEGGMENIHDMNTAYGFLGSVRSEVYIRDKAAVTEVDRFMSFIFELIFAYS